jgi:hypothetical protein
MKNILNVIADMLTLMAVCVAAIGHVLPWYDANRAGNLAPVFGLGEFQLQHSSWSGIALAVLGILICLSLLFNWGGTLRRLLNLGMFASAFGALLFELMIFSNYFHGQRRMRFDDTDVGFQMAMIATCVAVFFSLLRMLWTMQPSRRASPAQLDKKPETPLLGERRGLSTPSGPPPGAPA